MNDDRALSKAYGPEMAKRIRRRLDDLAAADTLQTMRSLPGRCHELEGNRKGELAIDLVHPRRLIFAPDHVPLPSKPDGGLDWTKVTAIRVIEVVDYH